MHVNLITTVITLSDKRNKQQYFRTSPRTNDLFIKPSYAVTNTHVFRRLCWRHCQCRLLS